LKEYASASLKDDRGFALSLVNENGRLLKYFSSDIQNDEEVFTAAVANTEGVLADSCVSNSFHRTTEIHHLCRLVESIRSKLEAHHSFVWDILRGIGVQESEDHQSNDHQLPPAKKPRTCLLSLPLLNLGAETSIAWKRSIAEYAGIPYGAELKVLRAALANLEKCGF
jgi:hypothetical protein